MSSLARHFAAWWPRPGGKVGVRSGRCHWKDAASYGCRRQLYPTAIDRLTGVQPRYTPCPPLMKTKNIHHRVLLPAKPSDVFTALLDSKLHSQFTEEFANIDARAGGSFRCYGDYITGITLELEPDECIIQAWRSRNWPKGTYSIIAFKLAAKPGGKTELRFSQIGVPANDYADKNKGWRTHYWEPLRRFLGRHKRPDS